MPLYEYQCRKCHHRFERIQKFSDPLVRKCPKCKTGRVEKLLSAPAVQFKGTGWYVTDYAGKKGGEKADGGGKSESDSSAGKDSGKDSGEKSAGSGKPAGSDKTSSGKGRGSGRSSKD